MRTFATAAGGVFASLVVVYGRHVAEMTEGKKLQVTCQQFGAEETTGDDPLDMDMAEEIDPMDETWVPAEGTLGKGKGKGKGGGGFSYDSLKEIEPFDMDETWVPMGPKGKGKGKGGASFRAGKPAQCRCPAGSKYGRLGEGSLEGSGLAHSCRLEDSDTFDAVLAERGSCGCIPVAPSEIEDVEELDSGRVEPPASCETFRAETAIEHGDMHVKLDAETLDCKCPDGTLFAQALMIEPTGAGLNVRGTEDDPIHVGCWAPEGKFSSVVAKQGGCICKAVMDNEPWE